MMNTYPTKLKVIEGKLQYLTLKYNNQLWRQNQFDSKLIYYVKINLTPQINVIFLKVKNKNTLKLLMILLHELAYTNHFS